MMELQTVLSDDSAEVDSDRLGVTDAWLERLYEGMVTARAVDTRSDALREAGEIRFYVASGGLEAVSVGGGMALEDGDWLFPSHRDVGMFLLRGGSVRAWFDQLFANRADLVKGRQIPGHASLPDGRFVSVSGRVGAQLPQAAGCALAIKTRHQRACALASFGEAAAASSGFSAAASIAARFRLPLVLLCRTRTSRSGAAIGRPASLAEQARVRGLSAARVDGSDALAVYRAVSEARHAAVEGGGTTLIEAVVTERAMFGDPDAGADDDCVDRLRRFLDHSGLWDAAREEALAARLHERIDEALQAARDEPAPAVESLFDDVYDSAPWPLQEQRERLFGRTGD